MKQKQNMKQEQNDKEMQFQNHGGKYLTTLSETIRPRRQKSLGSIQNIQKIKLTSLIQQKDREYCKW